MKISTSIKQSFNKAVGGKRDGLNIYRAATGVAGAIIAAPALKRVVNHPESNVALMRYVVAGSCATYAVDRVLRKDMTKMDLLVNIAVSFTNVKLTRKLTNTLLG